MALRGSQREPFISLDVALPGSLAGRIHPAKVELPGGKFLFRGAPVPGHRFAIDLETAPAFFIRQSELILRGNVTLLGQAAERFLTRGA